VAAKSAGGKLASPPKSWVQAEMLDKTVDLGTYEHQSAEPAALLSQSKVLGCAW